jgi:hypothetical protein
MEQENKCISSCIYERLEENYEENKPKDHNDFIPKIFVAVELDEKSQISFEQNGSRFFFSEKTLNSFLENNGDKKWKILVVKQGGV